MNTHDFDCVVILEKEGRKIKEVSVQTDVEPGNKVAFEMPFELPGEAGEYAVTVSFRLKEDTLWAKAGHEVAFGQGVFAKEVEKSYIADRPLAVNKPFEVIHGTFNLGVRGAEFEVLLSRNFNIKNEMDLKA